MYYAVGLEKKNNLYAREELYPGPGELWESVRDLEDVAVNWVGPSSPEVVEEMLSTFLRILENMGVEQVNLRSTASWEVEEAPERLVDISSIKGERFSRLAGRVAVDEVDLLSPKSFEERAMFGAGVEPTILVSTGASDTFEKPAGEGEEGVCLHVKNGSLVLHWTNMHRKGISRHKADYLRGSVDLSSFEDRVEIPWPEMGITLDTCEVGKLFSAILGNYYGWMVHTERIGGMRALREQLKRFRLVDGTKAERYAREALERIKKSGYCRDELGGKLDRLSVKEVKFGVAFFYELNPEEAASVGLGEGKAGRQVAPVTLDVYPTELSIFITNSADYAPEIAEVVSDQLELVLRMHRAPYTVERC